jgi:hypothetical protein
MDWEVEYTDEFEAWWNTLTEHEQEDVAAKVILLQRFGPALRRPHSDVIESSRHSNMKASSSSTPAGPIAFFMPLIPGGRRFC